MDVRWWHEHRRFGVAAANDAGFFGADTVALDSEAVTTDGDLVYASADRLYVATSRWGSWFMPRSTDEVTTSIHAFDTTTSGATRYAASGTVAGYLLGENYRHLYDAIRPFELLIYAVVLLGIVYVIYPPGHALPANGPGLPANW